MLSHLENPFGDTEATANFKYNFDKSHTIGGVRVYISRKGVAEKKGIRANLKDMMFDIESILLLMGRDTQSAARDFYNDLYRVFEHIADMRWNVFIYKMQSHGLMDEARFSRPAAAFYSMLSMVMLRR